MTVNVLNIDMSVEKTILFKAGIFFFRVIAINPAIDIAILLLISDMFDNNI